LELVLAEARHRLRGKVSNPLGIEALHRIRIEILHLLCTEVLERGGIKRLDVTRLERRELIWI